MTINLLLQITNNKVENKPRIGKICSCPVLLSLFFSPTTRSMLKAFHEGRLWKWMSGTQIEGIWLKMRKQNRGKRMYRLLTGMILQVGGAQTGFAFLFVSCCEFLSFTFIWIPGSRGISQRPPPPFRAPQKRMEFPTDPAFFNNQPRPREKSFPLKAVSSYTIESQPTSTAFKDWGGWSRRQLLGWIFAVTGLLPVGDEGGILRS